jgi:hypothetical protein
MKLENDALKLPITQMDGKSRPFSLNLWCPGEDSNLHARRHYPLKIARLPVPPPGHYGEVLY